MICSQNQFSNNLRDLDSNTLLNQLHCRRKLRYLKSSFIIKTENTSPRVSDDEEALSLKD